MSAEELQRQVEADELEDATHMSPRDFAKLIGVSPQLVYYYIRSGKIEAVQCLCGRKVIDKDQAREVFESRGREISKESDA